jgi:hypothetical protein
MRIKFISGRMEIETPIGETVTIRKRTSEDLAKFKGLIAGYTEKQLEATQEDLKGVASSEGTEYAEELAQMRDAVLEEISHRRSSGSAPTFPTVKDGTVPSIAPAPNFWPPFFLCLFLGWLGAHRFYAKKFKSGAIQLVTLGGCGLWALFDLILLLTSKFTSASGEVYRNPKPKVAWGVAGAVVLLAAISSSSSHPYTGDWEGNEQGFTHQIARIDSGGVFVLILGVGGADITHRGTIEDMNRRERIGEGKFDDTKYRLVLPRVTVVSERNVEMNHGNGLIRWSKDEPNRLVYLFTAEPGNRVSSFVLHRKK